MKKLKELFTQYEALPALSRHERKVLSDSDIETTTDTEKDITTPYAFPCGRCERKYKTLRGITRHRAEAGHYVQ